MQFFAGTALKLSKAVDQFEFSPETTLFAKWQTPVIGVFVYLLSLKILQKWIEYRGKPFDLTKVVFIHNILLSGASAILFYLTSKELLRLIDESSLFETWCDPAGKKTRGRLYFLYYINYLFKWWELFDTVLLALRGKPTPFLHVYHHASILMLVWSQMRAQTCQQWVPSTINLGVHVIMYFYFALHSIGIRVWWKEWVTIIQLVQFMVAILSGIIGLTMRILGEILQLSWSPLCWGNWSGSFFGLGILFSYLILFAKLYKQTYKNKPKQRRDKLELPLSAQQRPFTNKTPKDFDSGKVSSWSARKQD